MLPYTYSWQAFVLTVLQQSKLFSSSSKMSRRFPAREPSLAAEDCLSSIRKSDTNVCTERNTDSADNRAGEVIHVVGDVILLFGCRYPSKWLDASLQRRRNTRSPRFSVKLLILFMRFFTCRSMGWAGPLGCSDTNSRDCQSTFSQDAERVKATTHVFICK